MIGQPPRSTLFPSTPFFRSLSFEVSPADSNRLYATYVRGGDLFVRKLNPAATEVLFTAVAGGFGTDLITRIQVDGAGRTYIAGSTNSVDFPETDAVRDGDTYDAF